MMLLRRDLQLLARLPLNCWPAFARTLLELALARIRLRNDHSDLVGRTVLPVTAAQPRFTAAQSRLVDRVAYSIPRVAKRVPWRADCLVQALAAERWLRRHRIGSRLVIGVKKQPGAAPLEAHAWLEVADQVINGGNVAAFVRLVE